MRGCTRKAVVGAALAGLLLAACGQPVSPPAGSDADAGTGEAVHPDAIWFDVLAVSTQADMADPIVLAQDDGGLTDLWARHQFDDEPPPVEFTQQVVLGLARSEDACPDELVEARVTDAVLETTWLPPAGGCDQPLIPTAWAVAFHRADLPESLTVVLREHPGHGGDKEEAITLPPYDGPAAPEPSPPPRQMRPDDLDAVFAGHDLKRCPSQPRHRSEPRLDGPLSENPEIAEVQRRRAEFALPSDEATARRLREDPEANRAFGFPMTQAEFDGLMARNRPELIERLHAEYLSRHTATWGFSLVDQPAGGVLVIGFTADLEGHRARLAELFPDVPMRVVQAAATQEELRRAQELLHERFPHGGRPRISGSGSGTDFLEISVIDPNREDLDAIAAVVDPRIACVSPVLSGLPRD